MKIYKKFDNLLEREIAGEVIIVESLTGMCHVLNETGTLIWKNIDNKSQIILLMRYASNFLIQLKYK